MPGQPGQARPDPRGVPQADRSDRDLLRLHVQGDSEAFGLLFVRHRERLWAVALRTLGDQEEAADALQDAMISAFRRAGDFRGESAVTTWLHRIVVNACLDRIRRRAARPAASGMDEQTLDVLAQGSALADPGIDKDTALDVLAALRDAGPGPAGRAGPGGHARLPGSRHRRDPGHFPGHGEEPLRPGPGPAAALAGAPARGRPGTGGRRREPAGRTARLTSRGNG